MAEKTKYLDKAGLAKMWELVKGKMPTKLSQLTDDVVSGHYIPYVPLNGGLIASNTVDWGVTTGAPVAAFIDTSGGAVAFRKNCPTGGQMSMVIDGTVYVNEGQNAVIHTGNIGSQSVANADTATKLSTPRTIWGQSFDGTGNVRGLLTASTGTSHSGIKFGDAYISEMDRELIFQNVVALRFGADNWTWDSWAGLNYVPSTRTINLGIPDGKIFKWNGETKGGGTLNLPGITEFSTNGNLNIAPTNNLGIGTQSPDAKLHVAGSAHITGDATVDGTLNVKGNGLELYYTTPYIDFHYGNSTDDYDIRMINSRKGVLQINAATQIDLVSPVKASKGSLWVANGNTSVLNVNTSLMTSYVKAKFNLTSWFVGNVGIGTDAVSNAKLKVNGATYITGDCKIDGVIENGNFYTDADGWVYTPALRVGDESNEADIVLYDSDGNEHIFQLQKAIELGIFN